jgi:hypothetical protein
MINVLISGEPSKKETLKELMILGLNEEKKKIKYALEKTLKIIDNYEKTYGISTALFLEKFKNGEIEEDNNTFSWQAESKIANELEQKIKMFSDDEICFQ